MTPRPATVDLRAEEMGREAVACIIARTERPGRDPVQTIIMPRLVMGGVDSTLSKA